MRRASTSFESSIRATYRADNGRTSAQRIYEAGSIRLRHPRSEICEAILVNTAGGIVAGDRLAIELTVGPGATIALSSAAAEKVYRSDGARAHIVNRLALAQASRAFWIPHETIVFDGARLRRHFEVDMAPEASLMALELVVFGRAASGERDISGGFHDSWRIRRAGRLIFADETRIEGPIGAILARPGVANGAGAAALVLVAAPDVVARLDPVRTALDKICRNHPIEAAATLKDGIIVARLLAPTGELLRRAAADVLGVAGGIVVPRVWQ